MNYGLKDITIESKLIKLRELTIKDKDDLLAIVRDYSENATMKLYEAYRKSKETVAITMEKTGLMALINHFLKWNTEPLFDKQKIRNKIHDLADKDLFSPYGPMNEENLTYFTTDSIKKYIINAQNSNKFSRNTFRLGIENNNRLIGCIVFDTIKKVVNYNGNEITTIGDFGIFMDSTYGARKYLRHTISLMLCFVDKYLELNDKNILYISMTTHLCNQETLPILHTKWSIQRIANKENIDELIPTDYGLRKHFVALYSDIVKIFTPINQDITVKIGTNIV